MAASKQTASSRSKSGDEKKSPKSALEKAEERFRKMIPMLTEEVNSSDDIMEIVSHIAMKRADLGAKQAALKAKINTNKSYLKDVKVRITHLVSGKDSPVVVVINGSVVQHNLTINPSVDQEKLFSEEAIVAGERVAINDSAMVVQLNNLEEFGKLVSVKGSTVGDRENYVNLIMLTLEEHGAIPSVVKDESTNEAFNTVGFAIRDVLEAARIGTELLKVDLK